jgi:SAM-dependent methyltransferase
VKTTEETISRHYTAAAAGYAASLYHELDGKPLDRLLLRDLADRTRGLGTVCDLGCGPGQVAAFLKDCGADVCGVDLSTGMVDEARRRKPEIPFTVGDMLDLPHIDEWAAVAAFYAIVHFTSEQLLLALGNIWKALKPGGLLLLTFHIGSGGKHVDEFFGVAVDMNFVFLEVGPVLAKLIAEGFEVIRVLERAPYEGKEFPTRRAYILARKKAEDRERNSGQGQGQQSAVLK